MALQVVIDPGHYDKLNPGVIPGYYEGERMMVLSRFLADELVKRGAVVTMTKTSVEQNPSLDERGAMAAGKDLFISVHSDASGGNPPDPRPRGATAYYSVERPGSREFANWLSEFVSNAMNTVNNGSRARPYPDNPGRDYYAVLRAAIDAGVGTAFLMEHGYHTNPWDGAALMDDNVLRQVARAEANVIAMQYGLGWLYTVKQGDTLYGISRRTFVPLEVIAAINGIGGDFRIYPGQVLYIPY